MFAKRTSRGVEGPPTLKETYSRPDPRSQSCREGFANVRRGFCNFEASAFHGGNLFCGRAFAAGDDGASMAHAASGRCGLSGNEAYHGLLHVRLDEIGRGFFGIAADFADHDYRLGLRIAIKQVERVDKICADDWVPADADRGRLPDAALR